MDFKDVQENMANEGKIDRDAWHERIVEAIMKDQIGNLEWIVEHFVAEADDDHFEEWVKDYKAKKIGK